MSRCETTGDPVLFCEHCSTVQQLAADDHVLRAVAQLRRIPDLAALVEVADDAPVRMPTGKAKHGKATNSPMPTATAARDLCRGSLDALSEAVRVVAEEQRQSRDEWPDLAETPTFTSECGYLLEAADVWSEDEFCRRWVTSAAHKTHESLSRWVGEHVPRPPRYRCPNCGGRLNRDSYSADGEGEQLGCSDCGKVWHPKDIAHKATMETPTDLPTIAETLGIPRSTLFRWAAAGVVHPVTQHKPTPKHPALYMPSAVARLQRVVRTE